MKTVLYWTFILFLGTGFAAFAGFVTAFTANQHAPALCTVEETR